VPMEPLGGARLVLRDQWDLQEPKDPLDPLDKALVEVHPGLVDPLGRPEMLEPQEPMVLRAVQDLKVNMGQTLSIVLALVVDFFAVHKKKTGAKIKHKKKLKIF